MLKTNPIPEPTNALQYRAIGIIKAVYLPSQNNWWEGALLVQGRDETTMIPANMLGKMKHIVTKKLDLSQPHLWIVYPRTKNPTTKEIKPKKIIGAGGKVIKPVDQPPVKESPALAVQVDGVWSPEVLKPDIPELLEVKVDKDVFNIRGEVVYQNQEKKLVVVKINRDKVVRDGVEQPGFLKVTLQGNMPEAANKKFWDFIAKREGTDLVIQSASMIKDLATKRSNSNGRKFSKNKPSSDSKPPSFVPKDKTSTGENKPVAPVLKRKTL